MPDHVKFHNLPGTPEGERVVFAGASDTRKKLVKNISAESVITYWNRPAGGEVTNAKIPPPRGKKSKTLKPGKSVTLTAPSWLAGDRDAVAIISDAA